MGGKECIMSSNRGIRIMATRCPVALGLAVVFCAAALIAAEPAAKPASLVDAVKLRDKRAVLSILNDKVNVNAPQSDGATALHSAAYLEDPEMAALLIGAGAKADTPNNYGFTPLALAAGNGNAEIIGQLLKAGANPTGA